MRDTGANPHGCRFGQLVMRARRTRTALHAVLIAGLGGNLNVLARVVDLLSEEAGEEESAAVDHVGWASKEFEVHQQRRWTGRLRNLDSYDSVIIYRPAGCGIAPPGLFALPRPELSPK